MCLKYCEHVREESEGLALMGIPKEEKLKTIHNNNGKEGFKSSACFDKEIYSFTAVK